MPPVAAVGFAIAIAIDIVVAVGERDVCGGGGGGGSRRRLEAPWNDVYHDGQIDSEYLLKGKLQEDLSCVVPVV